MNDIADLLEDNPWDEDISGEDSGSDKDWGPPQAQEDSTDSDNEPVNNNEAGAVTSSTSSGNQAVVNEDPEVRVYMDPPVERPDMDTDKDSDDSDQPDGLIHHFSHRLLGSGAHSRKRKRANKGGRQQRLEAEEESEDDQELGDGDRRPVRRPPSIRDWIKTNPGLVGNNVPDYIKPVLEDEDQTTLENLSSAYDYYRLFQPDSFANEVVYQSRLYAVQKGFNKQLERLGKDTYRCTEALLLHSGYNGVPRRKMLWELKKDCHNALVADSIRRDDVDAVLQCLHFRDNSLLNDDAYFKVRPVFENLNKTGKWIKLRASSGAYSVDEIMVPYYGRHSSKQFIRGKPIRFGYKVNCFHFVFNF